MFSIDLPIISGKFSVFWWNTNYRAVFFNRRGWRVRNYWRKKGKEMKKKKRKNRLWRGYAAAVKETLRFHAAFGIPVYHHSEFLAITTCFFFFLIFFYLLVFFFSSVLFFMGPWQFHIMLMVLECLINQGF